MGFFRDNSGERDYRAPQDDDEHEYEDRLQPSPGKSSRTHGGSGVRGIPGKISLTARLVHRIDRYARSGRAAPGGERVQEVLARILGSSGQPLPEPVRRELETHTGIDASDVRVHTGPESARAAQTLDAKAFTIGRDIHFAAGAYAPESAAGRRLLAHEVAHVIQQRGLTPVDLEHAEVSEPGDAHEQYADEFAGLFEKSREQYPVNHADRAEPLGARKRAVPGLAAPPAPSHGPVVYRQSQEPHDETALERARRTKDIGDIKDVDDFSGAAEGERLEFIRILLNQDWVGPRDESALERIWGSFGSDVLRVASQNQQLWEQCVDRGAELDDLPEIQRIQQAFRADVQALARDIMLRNEAYVLTEMDALGIAADGGEELPPTGEQDQNLGHVQDTAQLLVEARQAQKELRQIPVGYHRIITRFGIHYTKATFDPSAPPHVSAVDVPEESAGRKHEFREWAAVKAQYDNLERVIAALADESPALYALVTQGSEQDLADAAAAGPRDARRAMGESMQAVLDNIRATIPKLGDDLDDRDLTALHQMLFAGQASGASGMDWCDPMHQWAAKDMLSDHETQEFWIKLGLGTLAAAAFIVAELATAGLATFIAAGVGLGTTGFLVGDSWEHAQDLAGAAGASAGSDSQIVSQEQATAAQHEAVLESVFGFLDAIPGLRAVRTGATAMRQGGRAVGREIVEEGLEQAGKESAEEGLEQAGKESAEEALQRGIGEGVEEGLEQAGKETAQKLRPEDAANWNELQAKYIGRSVDEAGVPHGYQTYKYGNRTFLRRVRADDALFAKLTIDENGLIQVARRSKSNRLSKPSHVAAVRMAIEVEHRVKLTDHHMHHVIPDQVVREDPLMQAALKHGLFDLDDASNLQPLVTKGGTPIEGLSKGLPTHGGPHPNYTKKIKAAAIEAAEKLRKKTKYQNLDDIPPELLKDAIQELQEEAWDILREWKGHLS